MRWLFRRLFLTASLTVLWSTAGEPQARDSECDKLQAQLDSAQAQWEKTDARFAQVDWTITHHLVAQNRLAGRNQFDGKRVIHFDLEHEEAATFGLHDAFTLSALIRPRELTGMILTRGPDTAEGEGYRLSLKDGKVQFNLVKSWRGDALRVETERPVDLGQWQNVTVTCDGSASARGIRIYLDGQPQKLKVNADTLHSSFESNETIRIGGGGGPGNNFRGQIRAVRIYRAALTADEAGVVSTEMPVTQIAQISPEKRTAVQALKIRLYFLERSAPAPMRDEWQRGCASPGQ
jgi:hypothetical protein